MEWQEEAVVLGVRRHGETAVIAELMTRSRGRHLGLVRGGRSRLQRPVLQPGNGVLATWRARLPEHMGTFTVEPIAFRAARLMETEIGVGGVQLLAGLLRLLAERDPHPRLYDGLLVLLENLEDPLSAGALLPRFELAVLEELGFGLDLSSCAATGQRDDLVYVSPRSGRAVSREAGAPWQDRLLPLPAFLANDRAKTHNWETGSPADTQILEAFRLTGFFLARHVYEPRGISEPGARAAFVEAVRRAGASGA